MSCYVLCITCGLVLAHVSWLNGHHRYDIPRGLASREKRAQASAKGETPVSSATFSKKGEERKGKGVSIHCGEIGYWLLWQFTCLMSLPGEDFLTKLLSFDPSRRLSVAFVSGLISTTVMNLHLQPTCIRRNVCGTLATSEPFIPRPKVLDLAIYSSRLCRLVLTMGEATEDSALTKPQHALHGPSSTSSLA